MLRGVERGLQGRFVDAEVRGSQRDVGRLGSLCSGILADPVDRVVVIRRED